VQLLLGDPRRHRQGFAYLMPLGLRILPLQGLLTAWTMLGFDRGDRIYPLDRPQAPRMSLVSTLPVRPTPGELAPRPLG
jgi:hypothetical protein